MSRPRQMVSFRLPLELQGAVNDFLREGDDGEAYPSRTAFVEHALWSLLAHHGVERHQYEGSEPVQLPLSGASAHTDADITELRASVSDLRDEMERLMDAIRRQGAMIPPRPRAQIPPDPLPDLDPPLLRNPRPPRPSMNPSNVWDDRPDEPE